MNAKRFATTLAVLFCVTPIASAAEDGSPRPNIVFILVDDLRHDVFSHTGHPFVQTPHIDGLAREGARLTSAFVTTSLCSPARASFLTGQYMHHHGVVDNQSRIPSGTVTFPQLLQKAGYRTAFIGKWHMGGSSDAPQRGFDHWVSFRGQGAYFPQGQTLNVDGQQVPQTEYITDELTRHAVDWLDERDGETPFLLYLSHKGVHGLYEPAPRHLDRYHDAPWTPPASMADTTKNYADKPMWVRDQRNSWHGVEFPYHGRAGQSIGEMYRHYCEMLLSIDESVGRIMKTLHARGLSRDTLVVFTSDGGHLWGEHGLIDKRCAYEASIRIPMIMRHPELVRAGIVLDDIVTNIDVAPTLLEYAGVDVPESIDGRSFLDLCTAESRQSAHPRELLYEYYWEPSFPQTPTTFALRDARYKFIQYHGIWDRDELYDLDNDPAEAHNLVDDPAHGERVQTLRRRLHERLGQTGGLAIPLGLRRGPGANLRRADGSPRAEFPASMIAPAATE